VTQYSSDEEEGEDGQRPTSRGNAPAKKSPAFNGAAFAEVVRATIKANEIAAASAKPQ